MKKICKIFKTYLKMVFQIYLSMDWNSWWEEML